MKRFFSDPLVHFILIGALLFVGFDYFKAPETGEEGVIVISASDIETLQANFQRTWSRPPTGEELDGLIEELVRDEIAVREAVAMGLDTDDAYIRRRLRTKMEILLDDIAGITTPSDEELQRYLDENPDYFRVPPRFAFAQVHFDPDRRGASLNGDLQETLRVLQSAGAQADPHQFGDLTMLPSRVPLTTPAVITRQFGAGFSEGIAALPVGEWGGPVKSGYGMHLVLVTDRTPARIPDLAEVRDAVEREWSARRSREVKEETYARLRERYTIIVEPRADGPVAAVRGGGRP